MPRRSGSLRGQKLAHRRCASFGIGVRRHEGRAVGLHFQPLGHGRPQSVRQSKTSHRPGSTVAVIPTRQRPTAATATPTRNTSREAVRPASGPTSRAARAATARLPVSPAPSRTRPGTGCRRRPPCPSATEATPGTKRPPRDDRTPGPDRCPSARTRRFPRRRRARCRPAVGIRCRESPDELIVVRLGRRPAPRRVGQPFVLADPVAGEPRKAGPGSRPDLREGLDPPLASSQGSPVKRLRSASMSIVSAAVSRAIRDAPWPAW